MSLKRQTYLQHQHIDQQQHSTACRIIRYISTGKRRLNYHKNSLIRSFIKAISIAPLQVHYNSEALTTQRGYCVEVSRRSATGNCEWRTCPGSLRDRLEQNSNPRPFGRKTTNLPMSHHAPRQVSCVKYESFGEIWCLVSRRQSSVSLCFNSLSASSSVIVACRSSKYNQLKCVLICSAPLLANLPKLSDNGVL